MKQLRTFLFGILLLALSACSAPAEQVAVVIPEGTMQVHFIDVGQGDSALILADGESMLIDGGNVADSSLVVSYLSQAGVERLDYIICTHGHEDHVGGLSGPLSQIPVGQVFSPVEEYDSNAFRNFLKYTQEQGLELTIPAVGDSWTVGEATVTVLGPVEEYDDANDTSIVVKVVYGEVSFLFTGDAELASETDMLDAGLDVSATVLKVGHHGSYTSTSYRFLDTVNPTYGVISCGVDNDYGHPHDEVMSRLRDAEVEVYRTDLQGTVVATTDGETVEFSTNKNENVDTNPGETTPGTYIGNRNSLVFHCPDCSSLPAEQNQVNLSSREEAIAQGYTPCGRCNP